MHEINLLPPHRRQTLRREVTVNSVLYFLTSVLYSLGITTGMGVVVLSVLWGYQWQLQGSEDAQTTAVIAQYQRLRDTIAEHNLLLEYIHGLGLHRTQWSDFLVAFLGTVPPGVEIGSLSGSSVVQDNEVRDVLFTLSGQAAARGTLTIFADRLRQLPGVTSVEAPNSNLIRRENPLYRFTIHLDSSNQSDDQAPQAQSSL